MLQYQCVCYFFLAEQGRCTFVLSFVCFNVASEVTEIGRISVVMFQTSLTMGNCN